MECLWSHVQLIIHSRISIMCTVYERAMESGITWSLTSVHCFKLQVHSISSFGLWLSWETFLHTGWWHSTNCHLITLHFCTALHSTHFQPVLNVQCVYHTLNVCSPRIQTIGSWQSHGGRHRAWPVGYVYSGFWLSCESGWDPACCSGAILCSSSASKAQKQVRYTGLFQMCF